MAKIGKNKKIIRITAIAVIVAVLSILAMILLIPQKGVLAKSLSVGNKYLSELNYESAIEEYSKVLDIDPMNEEALLGMAASYAGMGNIAMAEQIFNEHQLAENGNEEGLRIYAQILEKEARYEEALQILEQLIRLKDLDEDYSKKKELVKKILEGMNGYPYITSKDVTVCLQSGQVFTRGTNVLGALGTAEGFGEWNETASLQDAGFLGKAKSVYTTGATTAVVDENGDLWLAGSNRSGQMGDGSVRLIAESGWKKAEGISNVVKVAGGRICLFALTADGSVYSSGLNSSTGNVAAWHTTWKKESGLGTVVDLQAYEVPDDSTLDSIVVIRNSDGVAFKKMLYKEVYDYNTNSSQLGKNIWLMSGYGGDIVTILADGTVRYSYYTGRCDVSFPEEWQDSQNWEYKIPMSVYGCSLVGQAMYLLDEEGQLLYVYGGRVTTLTVSGEIQNIYTSGEYCVVQFTDGSYTLYDAEGKETQG